MVNSEIGETIDHNDFFSEIDPEINHFSQIFPDTQANFNSEYYDIGKFNLNCSTTSNDIAILHINIRSLFHKIEHLKGLLAQLKVKFDILCFTESWLSDSNKKLVSILGYNSFHSLRPAGQRGGGISVFIDKKFQVTTKSSVSSAVIEALFLEVKFSSRKFLLCTVYKPPNAQNQIFIRAFLDLFNNVNSNSFSDIMVCGDFNVNLLSPDPSEFLNSMAEISLIPTISKPTRITNTSASLIDNIFIKLPFNFISGILVYDISDHLPVFLIRKDFVPKKPNSLPQNISYRAINQHNMDTFFERIFEVSNNFALSSTADDSLDKFLKFIHDQYFSCFPIKSFTVSPKNFLKPWITGRVLADIRKRQSYYLLHKQGKLSDTFYNRFRNKVTNQIRVSERTYYRGKFEEFKGNARKSWELINSVLKGGSPTDSFSVINSVYGNSAKNTAKAFNDYFVDVGRDIAENIDASPTDPLGYLKGNFPQSFRLFETSPDEVVNVILGLKEKKCNTLEQIPVHVIKYISSIISPHLSSIINQCFSQGKFPDSLKIAKVLPIYKAGDKKSLSNYRPISLLSDMSKIFEKLIFKRLNSYVSKFRILNDVQYGFRPKLSTSHALLDQMQYIYDTLEDGDMVLSMFLDFRKAFDSINIPILLSKLKFYGIRGLPFRLLESYLTNRKQYTQIHGHSSEPKFITHGVPQGSTLGPFFFLLYINDLPNSSSLFKFTLYADDSTLSVAIPKSNLSNLVELVNSELKQVSSWIKSNKIAINYDKTKYIIFSYRKFTSDLPILFDGTEIEQVTSVRFLGLMVDEGLNFKLHVDHILSKLSKSVGIMNKLKYYFPLEVMQCLYRSFIVPYLDYGIEIWGGAYKNATEKIFVAQKKAIRATFNLPYNEHTTQFFKSFGVLKLKDIHLLKLASIMFKTLNYNSYPFLSIRLQTNADIHQHSTRISSRLRLPLYQRGKSQQSFIYQAIGFWNSITDKNYSSAGTFRRSLISQFIDKY